jgi:hypothetical protein
MKIFLVLIVIVGAYMYMLVKTTNIVLAQAQGIARVYQNADGYAETAALGSKAK